MYKSPRPNLFPTSTAPTPHAWARAPTKLHFTVLLRQSSSRKLRPKRPPTRKWLKCIDRVKHLCSTMLSIKLP